MRLVSTKFSSLVVIAGLTFMGSACSKKKSKGPVGSVQVETNEEDAEAGGVEVEDEFASAYGIMNFRQLAASYESVTGVTLNNADVLAEYEKQLASLPKSFDPASISAAKVSAATKLAASYCNALSLDDALLTEKLGSAIAGLGAMAPAELASGMLDAFYGPETSLQGERVEDEATVTALITDLRGVTSTDTGVIATADAVFMGSCAAILSSAEFYMY